MSPIVRHVTVADMTADSHHFKTKDQLIAEGYEPDYYPPCDYHTPEDTDGAQHPGTDVRPKDGSRPWRWYGEPETRRLYRKDTWEAICGVCHHLLLIADPRNHCRQCGEWIIRYDGRCDYCWEDYWDGIFGDYPPPTDCGCWKHSIYAERQICEERQTPPGPFQSRRYGDDEPRPAVAAAGRLL